MKNVIVTSYCYESHAWLVLLIWYGCLIYYV